MYKDLRSDANITITYVVVATCPLRLRHYCAGLFTVLTLFYGTTETKDTVVCTYTSIDVACAQLTIQPFSRMQKNTATPLSFERVRTTRLPTPLAKARPKSHPKSNDKHEVAAQEPAHAQSNARRPNHRKSQTAM
jgi:hypothetical protein